MSNPSVDEKRFKDITLEDVEVAIEVIEHFMSKITRAKYALQKVNAMSGGTSSRKSFNPSNMTFDDMVEMATQIESRKEAKRRGVDFKETSTEEDVGTMSDEDIKRAKDLVKKIQGDGSNIVKTP